MKKRSLYPLIIVLLLSCQKNINTKTTYSDYFTNLKKVLSDSLSDGDFERLDFSNSIITNPHSSINYLRIPFNGTKLSDQFVLLKTNTNGKIFQGLIISLRKDRADSNNKNVYNGLIKIKSLNGAELLASRIINGYVSAFHAERTQRSFVVPSDSHVLPEVVVTCYVSAEREAYRYSDWINISDFLGGGDSGMYSSLDRSGGGGGSDGGGGGYFSGGTGEASAGTYGNNKPEVDNISDIEIKKDEPISVDFEFEDASTPIDVDKFIKCFSTVPDAGSTCSIEIFSDIPVDDHPDLFFNWSTGSPGHTFLQIKKTSGNQVVLQNIGFYPIQGWKTITTGPVEGIFLDNSSHEFNASLKMYLTPDQLKSTLNQMSKLAHQVKYDIDEYNCTDFALDIFNYTRTANPLIIPKYHLTGSTAPDGSNTPQGLYKKLTQMKGDSPESPNIAIPRMKQFVPKSNGPCN